MRLRSCGVSAVFGTTVALVATVVLALPRDSDRGARHSAVRATRGGVQRLDSTESPAHVVEDPEAVLASAADGVGDFTLSAPPGTGGPFASAALAEAGPIVGDSASGLRLAPSSDVRLPSSSPRPVLGRGPPAL